MGDKFKLVDKPKSGKADSQVMVNSDSGVKYAFHVTVDGGIGAMGLYTSKFRFAEATWKNGQGNVHSDVRNPAVSNETFLHWRMRIYRHTGVLIPHPNEVINAPFPMPASVT